MTETLAPCPFCGAPAEMEEAPGPTVDQSSWTVGCTERSDDAVLCYGYQSLTTFATKREAIAAWNRRAAQPSVSDAETAKALLKDIMVFDGTLEEGAKRVESALTASRTAGEAEAYARGIEAAKTILQKRCDQVLELLHSVPMADRHDRRVESGTIRDCIRDIEAIASQPTGQGET